MGHFACWFFSVDPWNPMAVKPGNEELAPKWMVYTGESQSKMDDVNAVVPHFFGNTSGMMMMMIRRMGMPFSNQAVFSRDAGPGFLSSREVRVTWSFPLNMTGFCFQLTTQYQSFEKHSVAWWSYILYIYIYILVRYTVPTIHPQKPPGIPSPTIMKDFG